MDGRKSMNIEIFQFQLLMIKIPLFGSKLHHDPILLKGVFITLQWQISESTKIWSFLEILIVNVFDLETTFSFYGNFSIKLFLYRISFRRIIYRLISCHIRCSNAYSINHILSCHLAKANWFVCFSMYSPSHLSLNDMLV